MSNFNPDPTAALLQGILDNGLRVFHIDEIRDIAASANISPSYLSKKLRQLSAKGWLVPVKKGVYHIGPSLSVSPVYANEIAMRLVKPAVISHYSAFRFHGLTEQVPQVTYVTTLETSRTPSLHEAQRKTAFKIHGLYYQIVKVKKEKFFGQERVKYGEGHFKVNNLERTLLDGFSMPEYCAGFGEVMFALEEACDRINLDRLIQYALQFDVATARRIGWALAELGIENEQTLKLAQKEHPGYRKLDPNQPPKGKYCSRWRLQLNH